MLAQLFFRSSHRNVRIREGALKLLVLGESLLLRENLGGPAIPSESLFTYYYNISAVSD